MKYLGLNCQGKACQSCGEIIQVYCTSGLCRECFHKRKNSRSLRSCKSRTYYCNTCGTPIEAGKECEACRQGDRERLSQYRVFCGMAEHRYVYQEQIGPIPAGYIIHHLNGLKGDNRIENLKAMPRSTHTGKEHIVALEIRIKELEELLRKEGY